MSLKQRLFIIIVVLGVSFSFISYTYAQDQIPDVILNQKLELVKYTTEKNTTVYYPQKVPFTAKLIDWRMSSEEEAIKIAESFIKNSEVEFGISFKDLKRDRITFSKDQGRDYLNPSAVISYKQYYQNIPIYNARIGIGINAYGVAVGFGERYFEGIINNITAPTTPIISSDEAKKIVRIHYNQTNIEPEINSELYIYSHPSALYYESKANKLIYILNIFSPIFKEVFIDSQTGEILLERKNSRDETSTLAPATAQSNINISKNDKASATPKKNSTIYYVIPIIIAVIVLPIIYFILRIIRKRK